MLVSGRVPFFYGKFIGKLRMPGQFWGWFYIIHFRTPSLPTMRFLFLLVSISHWDRFHSTKLTLCMKSLQELSLFKNNHLRWLSNLFHPIRTKHIPCVKMGSSSSPGILFLGWATKNQPKTIPLKLLKPTPPTPRLANLFLLFWTVNGIYGNWWIIPNSAINSATVFFFDLRPRLDANGKSEPKTIFSPN